ncbi:MAG TPA: type II secretion system ATPase GspE [Armatimonadota bacterium]|nr:type II secretion system ATPase GspE [Armatimonadota bacterium]
MQKKSIGEILVSAGLITDEQLSQAVEKGRQLGVGQKIGDVLVSMGLITERDKARCLGTQWGVPYVDLTDYTIEGEAVKCISQDVARRYKVIPIAKSDHKLTLAMKNPLDVFALDEVRLITGAEIEPVIATEEDIVSAVSEHYASGASTAEAVSELMDDFQTSEIAVAEGEKPDDEVSTEELRELSEEAPVVRLANLIITRGIQDRCSDIHLEPGKTSLRVRYRIDGIMHDGLIVPKKVQASLISRIKIMADMDIAEKRAPQDGRISGTVDGKQYDFRISTLPNIHGEKVVMRVLDKNSVMIGLSKLGFLPQTLEMFESIISRTYGIILVTGPTGSGKSTTLYSVLSKLNSGEKNILTIEDPVEYELAGITQSQVNPRAGLTFASGLRTMLRQDPDIIMVGEIRDQETAMIAVEAALTGHLVLATLHTNDAPGSITRLVDMGVEPFLIASAVVGVLAQRLLRLICVKCKETYMPPRDAIKRLGMNIDEGAEVTFSRGRGCEQCKGTGYRGRIGIYELMPITDKIRDLILAKASSYSIKEAAMEAGMKMLRDDALEKILLGLTSLEESLRVIYAG